MITSYFFYLNKTPKSLLYFLRAKEIVEEEEMILKRFSPIRESMCSRGCGVAMRDFAFYKLSVQVVINLEEEVIDSTVKNNS